MQRILDLIVVAAFDSGKRFIEIKALSFFVEFLQAARKVAMAFYLAVIGFIVTTIGLFVTLVEVANQYSAEGALGYSFPLLFGLSLLVAGGVAALWGLSEKRWLLAFGLEKRLQSFSPPTPSTTESSQVQDRAVTPEDLYVLLETLVDEKLNKIVAEKLAHESSVEQKTGPKSA